ncbi:MULTISPECIES: hypothetical protein [Eubacteriales]|uniref:DUF975 family protein n=1 Tax=Bittarella massiliensis (ex Durand et al. 2017) TaxID=1720313 RepID=A0AAQ1RUP4_9FIRM|nr:MULTISPECIES: hypothetical protein [Eubacteriales]ERJ00632.1 hypothetical protein HMPREF0262_00683 [Clostridium sp. ATCC 29733]MZL70204.1 hypothetical protein [Bittarella massiliensis (ex Durand et al. 2017)]SHF63253.1 hypothetical protein SAMN05444424_0129 [Bittarella massiliensis (ex Durand et al. 2017)]
MTQEIKRQAKELCRGQKGLYLVALVYSFLVTAGGTVGYFLPQGEALTLGLTLVSPAVKWLLFPLSLGFVRALWRVWEEERARMADLFWFYTAPGRLWRALVLGLCTDVLMSFFSTLLSRADGLMTVRGTGGLGTGLVLTIFSLLAVIFSLFVLLAKYCQALSPRRNPLQSVVASCKAMRHNAVQVIVLILSFILWVVPPELAGMAAEGYGLWAAIGVRLACSLYLAYVNSYMGMAQLILADFILRRRDPDYRPALED